MMDTNKARALHIYYEECVTESEGSFYLACAAIDAIDEGCDELELHAIEAIAGCDWAPEWAKERYAR